MQPSSLVVTSDVPVADRGEPSTVAATASHGIISYVASAAPTGTFSLTFGICSMGTATYSAASPNRSTGTITYTSGSISTSVTRSPPTASPSISISRSLRPWSSRRSWLPTRPSRLTSCAGDPGTESESTPLGAATVNDGYGLTVIAPVPTGMTVQSLSVEGGDATTSNQGVVTSCPAPSASQPTGCTAKYTGNYVDTAGLPYVDLALPSSVVITGGVDVTLPTVVMTLKATGAAGTVSHATLTEFVLTISVAVPIFGTTVATFDGYPTSGNSGTTGGRGHAAVDDAHPGASDGELHLVTTDRRNRRRSHVHADGLGFLGLTPVISVGASSSSVCSIAAGVVSFPAGRCASMPTRPVTPTTTPPPRSSRPSPSPKGAQTITSTSTAPPGHRRLVPPTRPRPRPPRASPWPSPSTPVVLGVLDLRR